MDFRLLGPLEVTDDGREVQLGGARLRALLAILLLRRGDVVPFDRLIEDLYGGRAPRSASKTVQAHVSRLRKALGTHSSLRTEAAGYVLDVRPGALDIDRLDELIWRGRAELGAGDAGLASLTFREALALWRGPALADFRYSDFAQSEITRLEEKRVGLIDDQVEADLALGRHAELVPELEALVGEFPLRERPRMQLMLALYRAGRQAEALECYAAARTALTEELGLEPSHELKRLQRAILDHDPALAVPKSRSAEAEISVRRGADFVGRSAELRILREALDDARAGHGGLVLVSGEPGIGKSRLADEFLAQAREERVRVLVGRCWEAGGAPVYWPWMQSLRTYIRDCEPDTLRRQLGAGAADLAQLFPELEELFPDLPAPPSVESEGSRFRLFEATAVFLKAAARERPTLVVLDDLHAADEPSLLLLRYVTRELADSRLLLLGLYRDVDPTVREPLASTIAGLTRESSTRRLPLSGLRASEVADFVERATESAASEGLVAAIYEETEGNPLFVGEIVRLLVAEGALGEPATATGWKGPVPEGVRAVIMQRLGHLSEDCKRALVIASVLGREFDLEALERATTLGRDAILDLCDEAERERVVAEVPGASRRRRFAHTLIRDTVYESIPAGRRAQLERRVGEVLEQLYEDDVESHLTELAHHFLAAVPAGEPATAFDYARRAGARAVELTAFEEAERLYGMALGVSSDDAGRLDVLLALGDAQARAGDPATSKATFREAAALAEALALPTRLGLAALGYGGRVVWDVQRGDEYLKPLLEKALLALGEDDDPLRVRLLSRLAAGPLRDAGYPAHVRHAMGEEALAMARRLDDPSTLAYALAASIAARHNPASTERQVSDSTELIEIATLAREPERAVEAYDHLANALLELGDMRGAHDALDAMEALAEKLRQPSQTFYVAEVRAQHALLEGRFDDAERLTQTAFEAGSRVLEWNARYTYGIQLFFLRRHQGRLHELAHVFGSDDDSARYRGYPIWDCLVMSFHRETGNGSLARDIFERFATERFSRLPFDEEWLVGMGLLAEEAASIGDGARAEVLHDLLLPYADRVATAYSEACTGSVSRYLGLLAWVSSHPGDAERHFEAAIGVNERIGAKPWLALTQRDFATMLRQRGAPGDGERASKLERAARECADEIGMSRVERSF
jgi:DNA-binding SARP family transcriptional activator